MGEIIKSFEVRSSRRQKPRKLRLLFDTGSFRTLVKGSAVKCMRGVMRLEEPKRFGGLGEGVFHVDRLILLEVRLLGIWCLQEAFVVDDEVLEDRYDILAGDDFMQLYNIRPDPRHRDVKLNPVSIEMSQTIRSQIKPITRCRLR